MEIPTTRKGDGENRADLETAENHREARGISMKLEGDKPSEQLCSSAQIQHIRLHLNDIPVVCELDRNERSSGGLHPFLSKRPSQMLIRSVSLVDHTDLVLSTAPTSTGAASMKV